VVPLRPRVVRVEGMRSIFAKKAEADKVYAQLAKESRPCFTGGIKGGGEVTVSVELSQAGGVPANTDASETCRGNCWGADLPWVPPTIVSCIAAVVRRVQFPPLAADRGALVMITMAFLPP